MRKIYVLALALFAVFAFSAVGTTSAFAASKYLFKGEEITKLIEASVEGELLLEDMGATGKPDILCSGIFDINIETGTLAFITDVLKLGGELLPEDDIECEDHAGVCSAPVLVLPLGLPWHVEIALVGAVFAELLLAEAGKVPGYEVDCNSLLGLVADKCEGATGAILKNAAEGVEAEFSETNEEITTPGTCSVGGAKQGLLQGVGVIKAAGGVLSLSE